MDVQGVVTEVRVLKKELYGGREIEIAYELFERFLFSNRCVFKNVMLQGRNISHAYQPSEDGYSKRIYFFERKDGNGWRYYAQSALGFHRHCYSEAG